MSEATTAAVKPAKSAKAESVDQTAIPAPTHVPPPPPVSAVAAPVVPTPIRAQKLRDAVPKKLVASSFKPLGYGDINMLTATAAAGTRFDEVMAPIFWVNAAPVVARDPLQTRNIRDGVGNKIIVQTEDMAFEAHLVIMSVVRDHMKSPCGLNVVCIGPSIDLETGEARPIDLRTGKAWVDPPKAE